MSTFPQPLAVVAEAVAAAERDWPVLAVDRRQYRNGDWGWPQSGPATRDPREVAERFAEGGPWHGKAAAHLVTGVLVDIDPQNDGTGDGLDLPYTTFAGKVRRGGIAHVVTGGGSRRTHRRFLPEDLRAWAMRNRVPALWENDAPSDDEGDQ